MGFVLLFTASIFTFYFHCLCVEHSIYIAFLHIINVLHLQSVYGALSMSVNLHTPRE